MINFQGELGGLSPGVGGELTAATSGSGEEEDSREPNTSPVEHIPTVQTIEK